MSFSFSSLIIKGMKPSKRASGDPYALALLLLLLLGGIVLLFFRGLTSEATYPTYLPILILALGHPVFVILSRYLPLTCPLKDKKGLFEIAIAEILLFGILLILSSSGTLGETAKGYSDGFAALLGVPGVLFHAFLLWQETMKKEGTSPLEKAMAGLLALAFAGLLVLALVLVFQGSLAFGFFFGLIPLFPLVFLLLSLE